MERKSTSTEYCSHKYNDLTGSNITEMLHNQGWGVLQTHLLNEKRGIGGIISILKY